MSKVILQMFIAGNVSTFFDIIVHEIWAGEKPEVLWSKIGPYKVLTHNLREHLCPDEVVECEVSKVFGI